MKHLTNNEVNEIIECTSAKLEALVNIAKMSQRTIHTDESEKERWEEIGKVASDEISKR